MLGIVVRITAESFSSGPIYLLIKTRYIRLSTQQTQLISDSARSNSEFLYDISFPREVANEYC